MRDRDGRDLSGWATAGKTAEPPLALAIAFHAWLSQSHEGLSETSRQQLLTAAPTSDALLGLLSVVGAALPFPPPAGPRSPVYGPDPLTLLVGDKRAAALEAGRAKTRYVPLARVQAEASTKADGGPAVDRLRSLGVVVAVVGDPKPSVLKTHRTVVHVNADGLRVFTLAPQAQSIQLTGVVLCFPTQTLRWSGPGMDVYNAIALMEQTNDAYRVTNGTFYQPLGPQPYMENVDRLWDRIFADARVDRTLRKRFVVWVEQDQRTAENVQVLRHGTLLDFYRYAAPYLTSAVGGPLLGLMAASTASTKADTLSALATAFVNHLQAQLEHGADAAGWAYVPPGLSGKALTTWALRVFQHSAAGTSDGTTQPLRVGWADDATAAEEDVDVPDLSTSLTEGAVAGETSRATEPVVEAPAKEVDVTAAIQTSRLALIRMVARRNADVSAAYQEYLSAMLTVDSPKERSSVRQHAEVRAAQAIGKAMLTLEMMNEGPRAVLTKLFGAATPPWRWMMDGVTDVWVCDVDAGYTFTPYPGSTLGRLVRGDQRMAEVLPPMEAKAAITLVNQWWLAGENSEGEKLGKMPLLDQYLLQLKLPPLAAGAQRKNLERVVDYGPGWRGPAHTTLEAMVAAGHTYVEHEIDKIPTPSRAKMNAMDGDQEDAFLEKQRRAGKVIEAMLKDGTGYVVLADTEAAYVRWLLQRSKATAPVDAPVPKERPAAPGTLYVRVLHVPAGAVDHVKAAMGKTVQQRGDVLSAVMEPSDAKSLRALLLSVRGGRIETRDEHNVVRTWTPEDGWQTMRDGAVTEAEAGGGLIEAFLASHKTLTDSHRKALLREAEFGRGREGVAHEVLEGMVAAGYTITEREISSIPDPSEAEFDRMNLGEEVEYAARQDLAPKVIEVTLRDPHGDNSIILKPIEATYVRWLLGRTGKAEVPVIPPNGFDVRVVSPAGYLEEVKAALGPAAQQSGEVISIMLTSDELSALARRLQGMGGGRIEARNEFGGGKTWDMENGWQFLPRLTKATSAEPTAKAVTTTVEVQHVVDPQGQRGYAAFTYRGEDLIGPVTRVGAKTVTVNVTGQHSDEDVAYVDVAVGAVRSDWRVEARRVLEGSYTVQQFVPLLAWIHEDRSVVGRARELITRVLLAEQGGAQSPTELHRDALVAIREALRGGGGGGGGTATTADDNIETATGEHLDAYTDFDDARIPQAQFEPVLAPEPIRSVVSPAEHAEIAALIRRAQAGDMSVIGRKGYAHTMGEQSMMRSFVRKMNQRLDGEEATQLKQALAWLKRRKTLTTTEAPLTPETLAMIFSRYLPGWDMRENPTVLRSWPDGDKDTRTVDSHVQGHLDYVAQAVLGQRLDLPYARAAESPRGPASISFGWTTLRLRDDVKSLPPEEVLKLLMRPLPSERAAETSEDVLYITPWSELPTPQATTKWEYVNRVHTQVSAVKVGAAIRTAYVPFRSWTITAPDGRTANLTAPVYKAEEGPTEVQYPITKTHWKGLYDIGFGDAVAEAIPLIEIDVSALPSAKHTTNTAICPVCFGYWARVGGAQNMAQHRYRRLGWGYNVSPCWGSGYPQWQDASAGTQHAYEQHMDRARVWLDRLRDLQDDPKRHEFRLVVEDVGADGGPVLESDSKRVALYGRYKVTIFSVGYGHSRWQKLYDGKLGMIRESAESELRAAAFYQHCVRLWPTLHPEIPTDFAAPASVVSEVQQLLDIVVAPDWRVTAETADYHTAMEGRSPIGGHRRLVTITRVGSGAWTISTASNQLDTTRRPTLEDAQRAVTPWLLGTGEWPAGVTKPAVVEPGTRQLQAADGKWYTIRVVLPGQGYGQGWKLVNTGGPLLEFYWGPTASPDDGSYTGEQYDLDTLKDTSIRLQDGTVFNGPEYVQALQLARAYASAATAQPTTATVRWNVVNQDSNGPTSLTASGAGGRRFVRLLRTGGGRWSIGDEGTSSIHASVMRSTLEEAQQAAAPWLLEDGPWPGPESVKSVKTPTPELAAELHLNWDRSAGERWTGLDGWLTVADVYEERGGWYWTGTVEAKGVWTPPAGPYSTDKEAIAAADKNFSPGWRRRFKTDPEVGEVEVTAPALPDLSYANLQDGQVVDTEQPYTASGVTFDAAKGVGRIPDNSEVNHQGFVFWLRPSEFLSLTPPMEQTAEKAQAWQASLTQGIRVGPPVLRVDSNFRVIGHEGRHRMAAIRVRSDAPVPVQVFSEGKRARHFESFDFSTVDLIGEGDVQWDPIKRAERQKLWAIDQKLHKAASATPVVGETVWAVVAKDRSGEPKVITGTSADGTRVAMFTRASGGAWHVQQQGAAESGDTVIASRERSLDAAKDWAAYWLRTGRTEPSWERAERLYGVPAGIGAANDVLASARLGRGTNESMEAYYARDPVVKARVDAANAYIAAKTGKTVVPVVTAPVMPATPTPAKTATTPTTVHPLWRLSPVQALTRFLDHPVDLSTVSAALWPTQDRAGMFTGRVQDLPTLQAVLGVFGHTPSDEMAMQILDAFGLASRTVPADFFTEGHHTVLLGMCRELQQKDHTSNMRAGVWTQWAPYAALGLLGAKGVAADALYRTFLIEPGVGKLVWTYGATRMVFHLRRILIRRLNAQEPAASTRLFQELLADGAPLTPCPFRAGAHRQKLVADAAGARTADARDRVVAQALVDYPTLIEHGRVAKYPEDMQWKFKGHVVLKVPTAPDVFSKLVAKLYDAAPGLDYLEQVFSDASGSSGWAGETLDRLLDSLSLRLARPDMVARYPDYLRKLPGAPS